MKIHFLHLVGVVLVCALSGCATGSKKSTAPTDPRAQREAIRQDMAYLHSDHPVVSHPGTLVVQGVTLENTEFDIPVEVNSRVEYWVGYFTGKGRKHFERYLERSEHFIPFIQPILRQNGMPQDLVYLAMIESGFNNHARSSAKAVGPWQFITWTGRRYGMMVNWWVDERRDTRKSTVSAAHYLKDLHSIFGSWELAAAAYNAGEAKVARAIRRFGSKDFWVLARQKFFRPETRDYVPKIMAAAMVAKNRTQFGFIAAKPQLHEGEVLAGDGQIVKVEERDPSDVARGDEPVPEEYQGAPGEEEIVPATLTVPLESAKPSFEAQLVRATDVRIPMVNKQGQVSGQRIEEFEIEGPADLLKIARAAGLSYTTVKALNPEILRWCTPPGVKSYRVKLPSSARALFMATYNHEAYPRKVEFLSHKIRRGDTVDRVARHYGIRPEAISELNGISRKSYLRFGSPLLLPMPNDRSRSFASLEVKDAPERSRRYRAKSRRARGVYRVSFENRAKARTIN